MNAQTKNRIILAVVIVLLALLLPVLFMPNDDYYRQEEGWLAEIIAVLIIALAAILALALISIVVGLLIGFLLWWLTRGLSYILRISGIENFFRKHQDLIKRISLALLIIIIFFCSLFLLAIIFPSSEKTSFDNESYDEVETHKTIDQLFDDFFLEFNKIEVK